MHVRFKVNVTDCVQCMLVPASRHIISASSGQIADKQV